MLLLCLAYINNNLKELQYFMHIFIKNMTFSQKKQHIKDYYLSHILIILFLFFTVGSLINAIFINPIDKTLLHISIVTNHISAYQATNLMHSITNHAPPPHGYTFTHSLISDLIEEDYTSFQRRQRFVTLVATREIDVIITDTENFKELSYRGYFMPIKKVTLNQKILDNATYNGFGLYLDQNPILLDVGIYSENLIIAFVINTTRLNNIYIVLDYFFAKNH
jgi:hypothetical protein